MTLLFDQNISYKVPKRIQDIFPGAKHLSDIGLQYFSDLEIWEYSKVNNYCIVTFDSDFIDLSTLKGFPPKIIWFRTGNTTTDYLTEVIRTNSIIIRAFLTNDEEASLELK